MYLHSKLQVSVEEIRILTEGNDPYDDKMIMNKLFHHNLKLLLVTEGIKGCRYYTKVWSINKIFREFFLHSFRAPFIFLNFRIRTCKKHFLGLIDFFFFFGSLFIWSWLIFNMFLLLHRTLKVGFTVLRWKQLTQLELVILLLVGFWAYCLHIHTFTR